MKKTEKVRIGQEDIYMRKSFDGWRVVYPITKEDGTRDWKNLVTGGNVWRMLKVLFFVAVLIGSVFLYRHDIDTCIDKLKYATENPCEWCNVVRSAQSQRGYIQEEINWTIVPEEVIDDGGERP